MSLADFLKQETMASPAESPNPIRGSGGGLADAVPAEIEGEQPAALSEGEYVVPADVVSMLGDGSTEAGSRILTRLVDQLRGAKQSDGGGENGKGQAGTIADLLG